VQVTNEIGCVGIDSIHVTIIEYTEIVTELPDTFIICEGESVQINLIINNGAPPYSIDWTGLYDTTASITVSPVTTTLYTAIITDFCGIIVSDSVLVIVNPIPDVNLGSDTTLSLCEGDSLFLSAGYGYTSCQWQDGSTDSIFLVNETGLYWVYAVNEFGCEITDSVFVTIVEYSDMVTEMIDSTEICQGETIQLDVFVEFGAPPYDYQWIGLSNNSSVITISPEETTWYYVTITDFCEFTISDSALVVVHPTPTLSLGDDTVVCIEQTPVILDAGYGFTYSWQDGSDEQIYYASETGVFSVTVTDEYGCQTYDEIGIFVSNPEPDLGEDGYFCEGDSVVLDAGNFSYFFWQDGSVNRFYTVDTSGLYAVSVTDSLGCIDSASVIFDYYQLPVVDLGPDREFCTGDTVVLDSEPGDYTYLWNGEPGGSSMTVNQEGSYVLEVSNICDTITDEVYVTEWPIPPIELGSDKLLTPGKELTLDAGPGFLEYLWQDDSQDRYFKVVYDEAHGDYLLCYVDVYDGHCYNNDSIKIEFFVVDIPNVFTPNGDGSNDLFLPMDNGFTGVKTNKMIVFNRWGEKVWESSNFREGWDGNVNGRKAAEGVYYWILEVFYGPQDQKKVSKGSVNLIR